MHYDRPNRVRSFFVTILLAATLLAGCTIPAQTPAQPPEPTTEDSSAPLLLAQNHPEQLLRTLPLSFEPNVGQLADSTAFQARGAGFEVRVHENEAQLLLASPNGAAQTQDRAAMLRMQMIGGEASPTVEGLDPLAGMVNYLIGRDPAAWHTDIATYARVRMRAVYPGIDLEFYGGRDHVEYDFVVAPDADADRIRLRFTGADELHLDDAGNLHLAMGERQLVQRKPVLYQELGGVRSPVDGAFVLHDSQEVSFAVGDYDRSRPLVIDPIFAVSTFFGGTGEDAVHGVGLDAAGNIYIAGQTTSADLGGSESLRPYMGSPDSYTAMHGDAFVAKLNPAGTELIYFTYFGGTGGDAAYAMVVDDGGQVAITGATESVDFPVTASAYRNTAPGRQPGDEYMYKTTNGGADWTAGGQGISSGLFGTSGNSVHAIVIDPSNPSTVYAATQRGVYKSTNGGDLWEPRTNGMTTDLLPSEMEALSLAIDPNTPSTLYAGTYGYGLYKTTDGADSWDYISDALGDPDNDSGVRFVSALAVDPTNPQIVHAGTPRGVFKSGNGGSTWTRATMPNDPGPAVAPDAVAPAGSLLVRDILTGTTISLVVAPSNPSILFAGTEEEVGVMKSTDGGATYTTVLSAPDDNVYALAVHPTQPNTVYAAVGYSLQKSTNGGASWDEIVDGLDFAAVVTALAIDPGNPSAVYAGTMDDGVFKSTNGGDHWGAVDEGFFNEDVRSLAIDPSNSSIVYAGTASDTGPAVAGADVFVSQLGATGADLIYSTYFGGFDVEAGRDIVRNDAGNLYITGYTSSDGLATAGAFQPARAGGIDSFVAKFDPTASGDASLAYATYLGGSSAEAQKTFASDGTNFRGATTASIAVDSAGRAYLTGFTDSTDFPTTGNAFDDSFNGGQADAYVSQVSADGAALLYSTYLGGSTLPDPRAGSGFDGGFDIDLDGSGLVYVTGETISSDFPTKNAYSTDYNGADYLGGDAFVAKFDLGQSGANSLVYSTYLGGERDDGATAIDVSDDGVVTVGGYTNSGDFPITRFSALDCQVSGGAYKSTNAAGSWSEASAGLTTNRLQSIAVHPTRPNTIFAGGSDSRSGTFVPEESDGGLFVSSDGGGSWTRITNGLTIPAINDITFDPSDPNTLYAAAGDRFTVSGNVEVLGGLFKSNDGGISWALLPGLPQDKIFETVVVDPNDGQRVYTAHRSTFAGSGSTIYASTDGGASWTPSNAGLPSEFGVAALAIAATDPATLYVAVGGSVSGAEYGLYKSTNGGAGWSPTNNDIGNFYGIESIVADPQTPSTVYVTGPGVYKSTNGGANWQPANTGLPSSILYGAPETNAIAVDPQNPATLYLGVGDNGAFSSSRLYKSEDAAATWEMMSDGLPWIGMRDLSVAPGRPAEIQMATKQSLVAQDLFVAQLDASGSSLLFATFVGGGARETIYDVAVLGSTIHFAGETTSADYPSTANALQPAFIGGDPDAGDPVADGFLSIIDLASAYAPCAEHVFLPQVVN